MQYLTVVVLVAFMALAAAHEYPYHGHHDDHHHGHHDHGNYEFKYGVKDPKTGDIKSQWEHRYGDNVKGSYSLKEADGTTRVVDYHADGHSGFHADVKTIGLAHHPDTHQHHGHHDHHEHHVDHHHHHAAHHGDHHHHAHHGVYDHHAHHGVYNHHDHHGVYDHHGHGHGYGYGHGYAHGYGHGHATSYANIKRF